ncbi:ligand-binding sensor domain-containing protein [Olivibacter sitiensis]|uniref:ligand-binding sensor domain-containing protein n=1 Tax=Olivibacter sitiensis TaxID=376470 RepID=UPI0003FF6423|nr:triple tyrosine motif-containing protein [Olivibacter sitiensis]
MKKRTILVSLFWLSYAITFAQGRLALPQIINYSSEQYKGGIQNWDIAQDKKGILYFANNEGLLSFDGSYWNIYPLPNKTVLRSIAIDDDGRIFVGGQDEIGYFYPNDNGALHYYSLVELVPKEERHFADVWNIVIDDKEVFFRSTAKMLHFKDGKIRADKTTSEWLFIAKTPYGMLAQIAEQGLMRFENGYWKPWMKHPLLEHAAITSIVEFKQDTLLISTQKDGLYFLHQKQLSDNDFTLNSTLRQMRVHTMTKLENDWYAIGTNSAGIYIVDEKGTIIQHYFHQEGLSKNNIRHLFTDRDKNLWVALDGAINFIAANSSIKYIHPDRNNQMSSYAIHIFDDKLYIGTSVGLFYTPLASMQGDISFNKAYFSEVKHSTGQVWNLEEINDQLLMGHEDGGFVISGNEATKFFSGSGLWIYRPLSHVYPVKEIIAGTYLGLQQLSFEGNKLHDLGHFGTLYESLRFLVHEKNEERLWASHPYRGVFRFTLSKDNDAIADTKIYTEADGLPSTLYNYVFYVKNSMMVATANGIYQYNAQKDRFEPDMRFDKHFKGMAIQYLREDKEGNIWFLNHKKLGLIDFENKNDEEVYNIVTFPELDGKILGGYEAIYPHNKENIFIAANNGVIHLNYDRYIKNTQSPDILISSVKVINRNNLDSLLFGGYAPQTSQSPALSYTYDSFHFAFTTTMYGQEDNIEYSYKLEGYEKDWSPWSKKNEKDYTNLPPGNYVFQVMSRNGQHKVSAPVSYAFHIKPAWYVHPISMIFYGLALLLLILLLFKRQKKKLEQQHEVQMYLSQLELDKKEKEVVRLQNEKLENEIAYKNSELTTMTLDLIQRGEVLNKIKDVISSLARKDPNESETHIRHLLRLIRNVERSKEDWEHFTSHFNHINESFFNILKEKYPDITSTELRLCAFLKMNLSSKEIAQIMHITIKGVEVARYRLRKRLKLDSEVNLHEFLSRIHKTSKLPQS